MEYVERLCKNMQVFPPEDYITGEYLLADFDPVVSMEIHTTQNNFNSKSYSLSLEIVTSKYYQEVRACSFPELFSPQCVEL